MRKIDKMLQKVRADTQGGDMAFELGLVMPKGDKLEAVADVWCKNKKSMMQERAEFNTKQEAQAYLEGFEAKYPPDPRKDVLMISVIYDDVKE